MTHPFAIFGSGALCLVGLGTVACSSDRAGATSDGGAAGAGSGGHAGAASTGSGGHAGAPDAGSGGRAGAPGAGGASGVDGGKTLTFRATVVDQAVPGGAPLSGVKVCLIDRAGKENPALPCVTTDKQGAFALGGLPLNTELIARLTKPGYDPEIVALDAKDRDLVPFRSSIGMGNSYLTGVAGTWNEPVPPDPKAGAVSFFAIEPPSKDGGGTAGNGYDLSVGLTVAVKPVAGGGPFYYALSGLAPDAGSTVEGGGGGEFVNLPPGEYSFTFHHPTLQCTGFTGGIYGYPAGANAVRAPIFAAAWTSAIGVGCH